MKVSIESEPGRSISVQRTAGIGVRREKAALEQQTLFDATYQVRDAAA
jgi:hypothetical protein